MTENERDEGMLRSRAIADLRKRRDFRGHVLVYLLTNAAFVAVWAVTNADGFFWPIFLMIFWGIGLVMHGWDAYSGEDFSEDRVEREMHRLAGRH